MDQRRYELSEFRVVLDVWDNLPTTFRIIQAYEAWRDLGNWIEVHEPQFSSGIKERFEIAKKSTWSDYEQSGCGSHAGHFPRILI